MTVQEQQQVEEQELIQQIYEYAAGLMVDEGKTPEATKAQLIEKGLDEESAAHIVRQLETQIREAKKEQASKDIMYGSLWLVGGLLITIVTYSAASGGGTYVVTWGAIVFGAIQLIKGLANQSSL